MKKIIAIAFAATCFVACKKENEAESIPVNNAPKYKTVDFGSKPDNYTYDQYGRQVKIVSFDGSRVESSYSKGRVTRIHYDASGAVFRTYTIELNADGLQAKSYYKEAPGNYTAYEYGQDKRPSKVTSLNNGQLDLAEYYYKDGNLDSIRYYRNNAWTLTNVMEYWLDQPCVQKGPNAGIMYNGEPSKNMCKSLTHNSANGTSVKENYSYEYNAQGLLTKLTEVTNGNTQTGFYTYY
jgi:hypothetical protein